MISVCMCTYNGEKFIREQLDSIVMQTLLPDEIIVFDDASTDETGDIIKHYVYQNPNIKWNVLNRANNVGWKRNFFEAIMSAQGDIVFLADQDDVWDLQKIERMSKIICDNDEIQLLACGYSTLLMDGHSAEINSTLNSEKIVKVIESNRLIYPLRPGCTFCVKRSILPLFDMCWTENAPHDQTLWNLAFLNEGLYLYEWRGMIFRRHNQNASSSYENRYSFKRCQRKLLEIKTNLLLFSGYLECKKFNKKKKFLIQAVRWCNTRERMYNTNPLFYGIYMIIYIKYYPNVKVFLLDLYLSFRFFKKIKKEVIYDK